MTFTTVRIEGSIFTSDILDKIASGEIKGQFPGDFCLDSSSKVKDEIAYAWASAKSNWNLFKRHWNRLNDGVSGTSETRRYWIVPLLGVLGYDIVSLERAEVVNNQTYQFSHRAVNCGGFPIHIMGINDSLDKRRETGGPRLSPHALVQEYLNLTENLFALVTNGFSLRLLRDSTRLIKLSFIEFDLRSMMEEDHFSDFALMFRLLHATRMPKTPESGPESLIESYHQDSMESGTRIREKLSEAVEHFIKSMAEGFLNHPENTELRKRIDDLLNTNEIFSDETDEKDRKDKKSELEMSLYQNLLRLIYRLLFLMVIEERHFVYPKDADQKLKTIYYDHYSVTRLKKRCENLFTQQGKYSDLWTLLIQTFRLFEDGEKGNLLGIKPLGGLLFRPEAIGLLRNCKLRNDVLLSALENLTFSRQKRTGPRTRVNYGALNVEELGSVYEGLLDYSPEILKIGNMYQFSFKKGAERSSSGTHYTPEDLVQPLIRHSLDYIIEDKLKQCKTQEEREDALLSIHACDPTCGSGHVLLSVARRIGTELARVRTGEDQPSPLAIRKGIRDAITHCIYGVDINPMAVELCKVALWLEAHMAGLPLNFLDHRIKCGDSIVGVAHQEELKDGIPDEAFKNWPGDEADVVKEFSSLNRKERKLHLIQLVDAHADVNKLLVKIGTIQNHLNALPEETVEDIVFKAGAFEKIRENRDWTLIKTLADLRTAQFFHPKSKDNIENLVTQGAYAAYSIKQADDMSFKVKAAAEESNRRRFFHWVLEYCDIFLKGGFDLIIGNPPYLGVSAISGNYGYRYLNFINTTYAPTRGCDLVIYFLRRDFNLVNSNGVNALITTNSVSETRNREGGLDIILSQNGTINFARKSVRWSGIANLYVSIFSVVKNSCFYPKFLNNKSVEFINSLFGETEDIGNPFKLVQNQKRMFQGSKFLGDGFILTQQEKDILIEMDPRNSEVIFPCLNGRDVNEKFNQAPDRCIINFFDWDEEKSQTYIEPFRIVKEKVKPVRDRDKNKVFKELWWIYARNRPELAKYLSKVKKCFITACTSKYLSFSETHVNQVFTHATFIYTKDKFYDFGFLQSAIHEEWARKYGSALANTLRYTPTTCFETFPFPQDVSPEMEAELERMGENYHSHRKQLMYKMELGLTKTYNLFHKRDLTVEDVCEESQKDRETFESAFKDLVRLRELHKQMDHMVLRAYGWSDIHLAHDFYEVDYLPENDRVRYTISPEARKEILKRLLQLNHDIHEMEEKIAKEQPKEPKPKKPSLKKTEEENRSPVQKTLF